MSRPLVKNAKIKNSVHIFQQKQNKVGTHKNSLNETILLSNQNICQNWLVSKYSKVFAKKLCLS